MKFLLLAAIALTGFAMPHNEPKPKVWFMFFMRGEGKAPEGQNLLAGHLANMTAQAEAGKLKAAGPLKDPTEQRRGITVLIANERKEIDSYFTKDPFVEAGVMTVEAWEWNVDPKRFTTAIDPNALSEYRLVLIKRGKGMQPETAAMQRQHVAALNAFNKPDSPAVWGEVTGMDHVRQVLIVTTKDDSLITKGFKSDPLVSKAILEIEILPLFMSKGIIKG